jgi:4-hydroxythreonine-4-phosphate dehydrogenase
LLALDLIRGGNDALRRAMAELANDADVLVCDAETDNDLRTIADASMVLGRGTVWAGSAGLAYHLPAAAGFARVPLAFPNGPLTTGPTMFVVGSVSSVSREQVEVLTSSCDVKAMSIPPEILLAGERSPDWRAYELALQVELNTGRDVAVLPGAEFRMESGRGKSIADALAAMVRPYAGMVGAVVATGGESARAVLEAWGIRRLRLIGELEAGLPVSVSEGWNRQLPILTKAGGFGGPQALTHCRQFLRELDRSAAANFCRNKGFR